MSKPSTLSWPSAFAHRAWAVRVLVELATHARQGNPHRDYRIEQRSFADLQALSRTSNDADDEGLLWPVERGS